MPSADLMAGPQITILLACVYLHILIGSAVLNLFGDEDETSALMGENIRHRKSSLLRSLVVLNMHSSDRFVKRLRKCSRNAFREFNTRYRTQRFETTILSVRLIFGVIFEDYAHLSTLIPDGYFLLFDAGMSLQANEYLTGITSVSLVLGVSDRPTTGSCSTYDTRSAAAVRCSLNK